MLKDFFKLNAPYETFDRAAFVDRLKTSKYISDVLYEPDTLIEVKVSGVKFENVSLSKTTVSKVTFVDCTFRDCLFIGTHFKSVNFHGCKFINCNFFKATFEAVYARPHQFRRAILSDKYANIAAHLYHELRDNYYHESQREYKNEAEYYFAHWRRKYAYLQAKRNHKSGYLYLPRHIGSFLYGHLLGYGYRITNLVHTTIVLIAINIWANYTYAQYLFEAPVEPSLIKTIYFTLTTMATLGATGYSPDTDIGYLVVIVNVIFGVSILSATVGAVFKKLIR